MHSECHRSEFFCAPAKKCSLPAKPPAKKTLVWSGFNTWPRKSLLLKYCSIFQPSLELTVFRFISRKTDKNWISSCEVSKSRSNTFTPRKTFVLFYERIYTATFGTIQTFFEWDMFGFLSRRRQIQLREVNRGFKERAGCGERAVCTWWWFSMG